MTLNIDFILEDNDQVAVLVCIWFLPWNAARQMLR